MLSKYSLGISFSNDHAFVICLERGITGTAIKAHALVDFKPGEGLSQHVESMESYLANFLTANKIRDPDIFLGFPRPLSIVRKLTFPLAVKDDLESTIKYSIEKYIPLKAEELYFDTAVISENKDDNSVSAALVAVKKKDMMPFVDIAVSMDSGVAGIGINSLAAVNCFFHENDSVDKTGGDLFLVFHNGQGIDISFFINQEFILSKYIKLDGSEDLYALIKGQIEQIRESHGSLKSMAGLSLIGSGFDLSVIGRMDSDPGIKIIDAGMEKYSLPSPEFIPALGLALSGVLKKVMLPFNLLPVSKRKKESRKSAYMLFFLAFCFLILSLVWGGSYVVRQQMIQNRIDTELETLTSEVMDIEKKKGEIKDLEKKISSVNALKGDQVLIIDILKELSQIIPSGSWIQNFSYTHGKQIRINGYSEAASDLITLLEKSDVFQNVVFVSAITKSRDGKERFSIGFEIETAP